MQAILTNSSRLRRFAFAAISLMVVALTTAGCGQSSGSQGQSPQTVTQVVETVKTVQAPASEPTQTNKRSSTQNNDSFSMPDEVGKGLQEAQDDVQRVSGNPLFVTTSSDAGGAGRSQIIDTNWKVCSQNVAPGTSASEKTDISFAAVKLGEDCP